MSFIVYKSSAGAGKTFALVKDYLKIILSVDDPLRYRQVLAITFTNKAAAEMKERIISALKDLSNLKTCSEKGKVIAQILSKELSISETEIESKSEIILHSMLHNYSDIAISTIDKFVHRIIRTFAFDLKIPLNFNVELDANKLLKQAVDILISKVGTDQQLTKALINFTESKANEEKSWHIENELLEFSKNLLNDDAAPFLEKLKKLSLEDFNQLKEKLNTNINQYDNQLKKIGVQAIDSIDKTGITTDKLAQGERGIKKYFSYLAQCRYDKFEPTSTVLKIVKEDKWSSAKANADDKQIIESIKDELSILFIEAVNLIAENDSKINVYRILLKNIYSLALLNELEKILEEIKSQYGVLHISEFNKRIAAIVTIEPAPFIYERIGVKYKNFLIDEFQDTSVIQWQNLLPLIDNSLAEENFNLIVGDGKQAIYRWRGGEVEQFSELPNLVKQPVNLLSKQRQNTLQRNYKEELLDSNYRSKAEIVEFNNQFFELAANNLTDHFKKIYTNSKQKYNSLNTGGLVSISFLENDKNSAISFDENVCNKIEETINHLITNCNFQYKDICIIAPQNKHGNLIAQFLLQKNIPVISKESLLLKTSEHVNFIVALLQLLCKPNDIVAKAEAIKYILQNNNLLSNYHNYLTKYKNDISLLHFFEESIGKFLLLKWNELPVYETCENIVSEFNLGKSANPYIQFFLDAVYSYSNKNNNSIYNFIDWWNENGNKLSVILPDGLQAVNIMTIHKSKGLQYPVIIFPYANWNLDNRKDFEWAEFNDETMPELKSIILPLSKQIEKTPYSALYEEESNKSLLDHLNLLYVACTRPEERLYIISSKTKSSKNVSSFFVNYLTQANLYNDEETTFTIGEETNHKTNTHSEINNQISLTELSGTNWRSKIKISKSFNKKNDDEQTSGIDFGNKIHNALELIKSIDDVEKSVNELNQKGIITNTEIEKISAYLTEFITHKNIAPFFNKNDVIFTEKEIITETGKTNRPDKIIVSKEKTIVIDFKTGTIKDQHRKQVLEYTLLLKDMGYPNVEGYIIQTQTKTTELVR
ncbi:MAG: UvrD-helicase domain-containing protein [Bacteroidota bacterium]